MKKTEWDSHDAECRERVYTANDELAKRVRELESALTTMRERAEAAERDAAFQSDPPELAEAIYALHALGCRRGPDGWERPCGGCDGEGCWQCRGTGFFKIAKP